MHMTSLLPTVASFKVEAGQLLAAGLRLIAGEAAELALASPG
jgi:hypothetical protein